MLARTRGLWDSQDRHVGDRHRLFAAVAEAAEAASVLYPGSFVDLAPSFVWPSVTYVDVDRRAEQFFVDEDGVSELMARHGADPVTHSARFIRADYQDPLELDEQAFDLLVSLYGGFVSEHCTRHLRIGGTLLVNSSHGDAAMASIDERYRLAGVVTSSSAAYSVSSSALDRYLVPERPVEVTREHLHASGRGIAYTTSPFAYLFPEGPLSGPEPATGCGADQAGTAAAWPCAHTAPESSRSLNGPIAAPSRRSWDIIGAGRRRPTPAPTTRSVPSPRPSSSPKGPTP